MLEKLLAQMEIRALKVEEVIKIEFPELLDEVKTYNNESIQARRIIAEDLSSLPNNSNILEIGAGNLALSIQLASEGYTVTALEPVSAGFSLMQIMIEKYLIIAHEEKIDLTFIQSPIEEFQTNLEFEYIFSINVIEHVNDPEKALRKVNSLLKLGCDFRIYCPNYDFPYEPHFSKIMIRRKNKSFYLPFRRTIPHTFGDSLELYTSINFITYRKLVEISERTGFMVPLQGSAISALLIRARQDLLLRARHRLLSYLVDFIYTVRITGLFSYMPSRFQPIIDIRITKII